MGPIASNQSHFSPKYGLLLPQNGGFSPQNGVLAPPTTHFCPKWAPAPQHGVFLPQIESLLHLGSFLSPFPLDRILPPHMTPFPLSLALFPPQNPPFCPKLPRFPLKLNIYPQIGPFSPKISSLPPGNYSIFGDVFPKRLDFNPRQSSVKPRPLYGTWFGEATPISRARAGRCRDEGGAWPKGRGLAEGAGLGRRGGAWPKGRGLAGAREGRWQR